MKEINRALNCIVELGNKYRMFGFLVEIATALALGASLVAIVVVFVPFLLIAILVIGKFCAPYSQEIFNTLRDIFNI